MSPGIGARKRETSKGWFLFGVSPFLIPLSHQQEYFQAGVSTFSLDRLQPVSLWKPTTRFKSILGEKQGGTLLLNFIHLDCGARGVAGTRPLHPYTTGCSKWDYPTSQRPNLASWLAQCPRMPARARLVGGGCRCLLTSKVAKHMAFPHQESSRASRSARASEVAPGRKSSTYL